MHRRPIDVPPRVTAALRAALLGALATASAACSLAFDATSLTDGSGAATTGAGATSSTATSTTTTTTSAGGEGGGAAPSTTSAGGDGGGGTTTTTAGSTGSGGGGGSPPCSPTFCETEGADAAWCKDFDGPDPLLGVEAYEPDGDDFTTTIEVVDDPTHSCPSAVAVRVEPTGAFDPTYAVLGVDVGAGDDHFAWSFWVNRVSTDNDLWLAPTAIIAWTAGGDTGCQAYLFMRDEETESRVRFYTQGHDGAAWVGTGEVDVFLDHPTVGAWTHVELEVDLTTEPGAFVLRVDGEEQTFEVDALCGPAVDAYEARIGSFYTQYGHDTVYDDVTLRLLD